MSFGLAGGPRGDASAAGNDRLLIKEQPLQPIPVRCAHLIDCSSLASAIEDFGRFEPHDAYEARLRREHPRESSFWSLVD